MNEPHGNSVDIDTLDEAELDRMTQPATTVADVPVATNPMRPRPTPGDVLVATSEPTTAEVAQPVEREPNAVVSAAQIAHAIEKGEWTHNDHSTALWLNSAFPNVTGMQVEEVVSLLAQHGAVVE